MNNGNNEGKRSENIEENVLSVHPTNRGMGWVLAASPVDLIDWGIARVKGDRNAMCLKKIQEIVRTFAVDVIVMRRESENSKRRKRIHNLTNSVSQFAHDFGIEFRLFSRADVAKKFARFGATSRESVAEVLAQNIDALSSRLPPKRELWKSEDARLGLFDAAALMVTYFMERDLTENPFDESAA